ncbi:uncharacterized protein LOC116805576 [Drosophila grimshawi]|uniref:uncharacterized protein LOC116805576 n=1 Tax=Drosophila grimshawi TaxID=7222 RepID=UPI000C8708E8|nr:uncharacterized protein LOC116805576 [Drosophila grimshawi]
MCNWRICLQIVLFLLIVIWAFFCVKLFLDHFNRSEKSDTKDTRQDSDNYVQIARNQVFDNRYNSRLMDFIRKRNMDRGQRLELKQRLIIARNIVEQSAEASDAERTADIRLVDAKDSLPIRSGEVIEANELVAADDYNMAHFSEI